VSVATGARHPECLRVLAFSDPESEVWGAAWIPPGSSQTAVISVGERASPVAAALEGDESSESWRLALGDSNLAVEGLGDPGADADGSQGDFDQLCRVSGNVEADGQSREVSCLGWRSARSPAVLAGGVSSVRQVAAWFGPDDGFALLALRSSRAKGQDADAISAAMFAPVGPGPVADPRLSTTYAESGEPVRAGVEFWLQSGDDPDQQYPRRAVGQSIRASVRWTVDDLALQARPFHWHAGEREGPGIYLLGRRD
jgi:hypothetical protein